MVKTMGLNPGSTIYEVNDCEQITYHPVAQFSQWKNYYLPSQNSCEELG